MKLNKIEKEIVQQSSDYNFYIKNLYDLTHSYYFPSTLIHTICWQIFLEFNYLNYEIYHTAVQEHTTYTNSLVNLEKYLVCLGPNAYYLLVFDSSIIYDEPFELSLDIRHDMILDTGYSIWEYKMKDSVEKWFKYEYLYNRDKLTRNLSKTESAKSFGIYDKELLKLITKESLANYFIDAKWKIVISKPIAGHYTSYQPNKPHKISLSAIDTYHSLAGIYTSNYQGIFGATICYHTISEILKTNPKSKIYINNNQGFVISYDSNSDSCFIKTEIDPINFNELSITNGPLMGMTPRENEKCYFLNINNQNIETHIIGWSPDILYYEPYNQVKILTTPDTNPGDSGTVLIDSSGKELGFAFFRTGINAVKEFSAWIFAPSVYSFHKLRYK